MEALTYMGHAELSRTNSFLTRVTKVFMFSESGKMNDFGKLNIFGIQYNILATDVSKDELVDLIRNQSEKGFSMLYDKYSAALFGVICRIVTDNEAAEDVLQETFIKVWRKIDQYDNGKGSFFTWVLNIARNTSIDHVRSKESLQKQVTINGSALKESDTNAVEPLNVEHIDMRGIIIKMDRQYAQIMELIYFNGYTHEETAEALGIPLGTVKTRARKALQILREQF